MDGWLGGRANCRGEGLGVARVKEVLPAALSDIS